jgi:hypothetical protein
MAIMEPHATLRRCSVDGCERPHVALNFCEMHYLRVRRHGDPLVVGTPAPRQPTSAADPDAPCSKCGGPKIDVRWKRCESCREEGRLYQRKRTANPSKDAEEDLRNDPTPVVVLVEELRKHRAAGLSFSQSYDLAVPVALAAANSWERSVWQTVFTSQKRIYREAFVGVNPPSHSMISAIAWVLMARDNAPLQPETGQVHATLIC